LIVENDSALAEKLRKRDELNINGTDHGPFFVVSIYQESRLGELFLVRAEGGTVSRFPIPSAASNEREASSVSGPKHVAVRTEEFSRYGTLTRTILEWRDLPVEFAFWKYSREEDIEFLESAARSINDEVSHDDLVERYTNRSGESVERYRLHPSLRLTSRRAYGTAAWDLFFNVVGITASIMGVTGGTFAAAKFVAKVWRKAKDEASAHGYDREIDVVTPAGAALLAANWLMENDPDIARKLVATNNAHLHASEHGPYFVVSMTSSAHDELFIVAARGGGVTRIPLHPKQIES
jgi:hypothetical protein